MKGLEETIRALIGGSRGILAADESTGTITKRFEAHGVDSNPETRSNDRHLLAGTPGLAEFIGGMILFDETIRQKGTNSTMTALERQGIVPGIKVDKGTAAVGKRPKSRLTLGLDGLQERLGEYHDLGARFTKLADRTLKALCDTIPTSIPGIVFLSGGLDEETATRCLSPVNRQGPQPWELSYSFGRALQNTALKVWSGDSKNAETVQQALLHRARCNHQARRGKP